MRGYGVVHQRKRADLEQIVRRGLAHCARCGKRIRPDEPWDLGHDDIDRRRWSGPEHRACNRATSHLKLDSRRVSRSW